MSFAEKDLGPIAEGEARSVSFEVREGTCYGFSYISLRNFAYAGRGDSDPRGQLLLNFDGTLVMINGRNLSVLQEMIQMERVTRVRVGKPLNPNEPEIADIIVLLNEETQKLLEPTAR